MQKKSRKNYKKSEDLILFVSNEHSSKNINCYLSSFSSLFVSRNSQPKIIWHVHPRHMTRGKKMGLQDPEKQNKEVWDKVIYSSIFTGAIYKGRHRFSFPSLRIYVTICGMFMRLALYLCGTHSMTDYATFLLTCLG